MSGPVQHLVVWRARQLIADRSCWTQERLAATRNGHTAGPGSNRARRFCAVGALVRAAMDLTGGASWEAEELADAAQEAVLRLGGVPAGYTLEMINDDADGHALVLLLFDEYLAALEY